MQRFINLPIFSSPFRVLFLLTTISAFIMPALWVSFYVGKTAYTGTILTATNWHIYEMVFGFGGVLLAGFLLTSSSNWAGIKPYSGNHLVFLTLLWLIEKIFILIPSSNGTIVIVSGIAFTSYFFALLAMQLKHNPKNRNIFLPLIFFFLLAKILFLIGVNANHLKLVTVSKQLALDVIKIIIVIITGRIIPFFMRKKIANLVITMPAYLEKLSLYSLILAQVLSYFFIKEKWVSYIWLCVFSIHLMRQVYWKFWTSASIPMLWILHIAYLFLILSFLQEALKVNFPVLQRSALHTFTAGAVGIFAVGMITRVSLGHTGRDIKANWLIVIIFISVTLGAVLRISVPIFWPSWYLKSLHYSSGFWTFSFMLILIKFIPIWFKPRPDGK